MHGLCTRAEQAETGETPNARGWLRARGLPRPAGSLETADGAGSGLYWLAETSEQVRGLDRETAYRIGPTDRAFIQDRSSPYGATPMDCAQILVVSLSVMRPDPGPSRHRGLSHGHHLWSAWFTVSLGVLMLLDVT